MIVHPSISGERKNRSVEEQLDEISGLAAAINLDIVDINALNVNRVQAGHFLGKGQRENIARKIEELEPTIVVFNHALSPVQQRNLEKQWGVKVIDRTGLILEIFGARAQTKEGMLQVELAALDYQRSRLVRSWTHLERQRGGAGFMGGPGETQIELDRRLISERINKLKKELESVKRTRALGRKSRARVPFPVIALVGYTNAGKSTLFNKLTGANILAKDLLFATLDPTLRQIELPTGQKAIISDTVGFISDLPTHLIAAFSATLEETIQADVLLHVIDSSSQDAEAQKTDVIEILKNLGIEYEADQRVLETYNKIDRLDDHASNDIKRTTENNPQHLMISAITGQGIEVLIDTISQIITKRHSEAEYKIPYSDGKALSWLYENANVLTRIDQDKFIKCKIRADNAVIDKFYTKYGYKSE